MKAVYKFPPGNGICRNLLASYTFLRDPIGVISANMNKFSGTYSAYLLGIGKIIITENPAFIEHVLRGNHTNYQKSALSTKTAARLFGSGLLFSNGELWLRQRRMIQPGFHQNKIHGLYNIIAGASLDFLSTIPVSDSVDVYDLMKKLSFSVLIHSLFDLNLSSQTIAELSQGFTDLQDFLLKEVNEPFRKILYPLNRAEQRILEKSKKMRRIILEIIHKRRQDAEDHNDLLDMLLNSRYEDTGERMTEDQTIDEILVLLFAGHETTANSLSWILYLISANPETGRKLKSVVEKIVVYESPRNEYIQAVISEGMRLFPAAWMTERVAINDDTFHGFSYPKGTVIIPFFYGLHRSKTYWKDETLFEPERFISQDMVKNKKGKFFFPFGAGPRMCIGNNYAMAEMAIILQLFFNSYEVSPTKEIPGMWPLITLRPRNLFLNIQRI
jgi:cytochrome P450